MSTETKSDMKVVETEGLGEGAILETNTTEADYAADFDSMGLDDNLLRGIFGYGFEKPSPIQCRSILPFKSGRDLIAQAQSGTGKTAAFSIGTLSRINTADPACQAILLSPTHELAQQTHKVISAIARKMDVKIALCIGGTSIEACQADMKSAQIVVGTPGRVLDMLDKKILVTEKVCVVVLDEADEMLSRGFSESIRQIFSSVPESAQLTLFSATMPEEALDITKKFMRDPVKILVKREQLTLEGIKQFKVELPDDDMKMSVLSDFYSTMSISQCVIFCNTHRKVDFISRKMNEMNLPVSCTHGGLTPEQRDKILDEFRTGQTRVIITTDLLARGIDVQQVSLVINYDLPTNAENYLHRIGRSARFGRKGVAVNLVSPRDKQKLADLEAMYDTEIKPMPKDISKYL